MGFYRDDLGGKLEVELLHIRFQDAEGRARRLVGVREFPDFAPVAPLADDAGLLLRKPYDK